LTELILGCYESLLHHRGNITVVKIVYKDSTKALASCYLFYLKSGRLYYGGGYFEFIRYWKIFIRTS